MTALGCFACPEAIWPGIKAVLGEQLPQLRVCREETLAIPIARATRFARLELVSSEALPKIPSDEGDAVAAAATPAAGAVQAAYSRAATRRLPSFLVEAANHLDAAGTCVVAVLEASVAGPAEGEEQEEEAKEAAEQQASDQLLARLVQLVGPADPTVRHPSGEAAPDDGATAKSGGSKKAKGGKGKGGKGAAAAEEAPAVAVTLRDAALAAAAFPDHVAAALSGNSRPGTSGSSQPPIASARSGKGAAAAGAEAEDGAEAFPATAALAEAAKNTNLQQPCSLLAVLGEEGAGLAATMLQRWVLSLAVAADQRRRDRLLAERRTAMRAKQAAPVSLPELLDFCFPPHLQHPSSSGRLVVFAEHGPFDAAGNLCGGVGRSRPLTGTELMAMVHEVDRDDVLEAFQPRTGRGLPAAEKAQLLRDVFDGGKELPNLAVEQVAALLGSVPSGPDEQGRVSFHEVQAVVRQARRRRVAEMRRAFPELAGAALGKDEDEVDHADPAFRAPRRAVGRNRLRAKGSSAVRAPRPADSVLAATGRSAIGASGFTHTAGALSSALSGAVGTGRGAASRGLAFADGGRRTTAAGDDPVQDTGLLQTLRANSQRLQSGAAGAGAGRRGGGREAVRVSGGVLGDGKRDIGGEARLLATAGRSGAVLRATAAGRWQDGAAVTARFRSAEYGAGGMQNSALGALSQSLDRATAAAPRRRRGAEVVSGLAGKQADTASRKAAGSVRKRLLTSAVGTLDVKAKLSDNQRQRQLDWLTTKNSHMVQHIGGRRGGEHEAGVALNVRILRDEPSAEDDKWDSLCCVRGTAKGHHISRF